MVKKRFKNYWFCFEAFRINEEKNIKQKKIAIVTKSITFAEFNIITKLLDLKKEKGHIDFYFII